jgi:hypothetical protein
MSLHYFYDDSQYRQAQSHANAVNQLLNAPVRTDSLTTWWNAGDNTWPNLVQQDGSSGALLMMGRSGELADALDGADNAIQGLYCSNDTLVVFYFRCKIEGSFSRGFPGHNHTVVSIAPLEKYWGMVRQRQSGRTTLPMFQAPGGWAPLYPAQQNALYPQQPADADIYNGGIQLAEIRNRLGYVGAQGAFQNYIF